MAEGQLEDLLGGRVEGDERRRCGLGARGQGGGDPAAQGVGGDALRGHQPDGEPLGLREQAEREVGGGDLRVRGGPRLLLRGHDDLARPRGEAAEPLLGVEVGRGALRDEALLGRLLGDAHAPADVGPRRAGAAGLVDEVADEVVRDLAEVLGGQDGVAELVEGVVVDRGDRRDEVVESYCGGRWRVRHGVHYGLTLSCVNRRMTSTPSQDTGTECWAATTCLTCPSTGEEESPAPPRGRRARASRKEYV